MSQYRCYHNREYLYQKHIVERLTSKEIGKINGVSGPTILNWLHKHKIQILNFQVERYVETTRIKMNCRTNKLLNLIDGEICKGDLFKKYNESWPSNKVCLRTISRDINSLADLGKVEKREVFSAAGHTTIISKITNNKVKLPSS